MPAKKKAVKKAVRKAPGKRRSFGKVELTAREYEEYMLLKKPRVLEAFAEGCQKARTVGALLKAVEENLAGLRTLAKADRTAKVSDYIWRY